MQLWFRDQTPFRSMLLAPMLLVVTGVACSLPFAEDDPTSTPVPPTVTPTSTPEPTPTAVPPTPTATVARERCSSVGGRLQVLTDDVDAAMEGYNGAWGFALIDVECDALAESPTDYAQYPASAGKIVTFIAVLREVERKNFDYPEIEDHLELAVLISSDIAANHLTTLITPANIAEVTGLAGLSARSTFVHDWRLAWLAPADLARVWAALLRGELLSPEHTDLLLGLTQQADFPIGAGYDTFPEELGVDGYDYGQKAGYWVSTEEPDNLVGAGFIRLSNDPESAFAVVLMVETEMDDVFEPQRRKVFPLLLEFIRGEVEAHR